MSWILSHASFHKMSVVDGASSSRGIGTQFDWLLRWRIKPCPPFGHPAPYEASAISRTILPQDDNNRRATRGSRPNPVRRRSFAPRVPPFENRVPRYIDPRDIEAAAVCTSRTRECTRVREECNPCVLSSFLAGRVSPVSSSTPLSSRDHELSARAPAHGAAVHNRAEPGNRPLQARFKSDATPSSTLKSKCPRYLSFEFV